MQDNKTGGRGEDSGRRRRATDGLRPQSARSAQTTDTRGETIQRPAGAQRRARKNAPAEPQPTRANGFPAQTSTSNSAKRAPQPTAASFECATDGVTNTWCLDSSTNDGTPTSAEAQGERRAAGRFFGGVEGVFCKLPPPDNNFVATRSASPRDEQAITETDGATNLWCGLGPPNVGPPTRASKHPSELHERGYPATTGGVVDELPPTDTAIYGISTRPMQMRNGPANRGVDGVSLVWSREGTSNDGPRAREETQAAQPYTFIFPAAPEDVQRKRPPPGYVENDFASKRAAPPRNNTLDVRTHSSKVGHSESAKVESNVSEPSKHPALRGDDDLPWPLRRQTSNSNLDGVARAQTVARQSAEPPSIWRDKVGSSFKDTTSGDTPKSGSSNVVGAWAGDGKSTNAQNRKNWVDRHQPHGRRVKSRDSRTPNKEGSAKPHGGDKSLTERLGSIQERLEKLNPDVWFSHAPEGTDVGVDGNKKECKKALTLEQTPEDEPLQQTHAPTQKTWHLIGRQARGSFFNALSALLICGGEVLWDRNEDLRRLTPQAQKYFKHLQEIKANMENGLPAILRVSWLPIVRTNLRSLHEGNHIDTESPDSTLEILEPRMLYFAIFHMLQYAFHFSPLQLRKTGAKFPTA